MKDYHRFYASFNRLPCNGDRDDMKEILVSSFTDGRTTHLHEMTQKEYDAMCASLEERSTNTGMPSLSPRRTPPSSEIWANIQGYHAATVLLDMPRASFSTGS